MKKYAYINGYCPVQNEDYSIKVTYLEYKPGYQHIFIKDVFSCDYYNNHGYCNIKECPIYTSAPEEL